MSAQSQIANSLSHILDAVPVSIYCKDLSGKYITCNKYMLEMIGLDREELIGKTDKELIWKEIAEELQKIDLLVVKNRAKYEVEETPLISNRQKRTYLSTKTPLFDETGKKIIGLIGVSVDVTDRKQAEDLYTKNEIANKIADFSNRVAGAVAHELKTPLTNIMLSVESIQQSLFSKESQKNKEAAITQKIEFIKRIIRRSSYIIDDILLKIKAFALGKVTSVMNERSITKDIKEFMSMYPFMKDEQKLVNLKNIDAPKNDFKYLGDPLLTQQIFFNFMKNSIRAIYEAEKTEKGKITIELKNNTKTGDKFNYVIFRDTGTGIPREYVGKAFDHFESLKTKSGGTGLGLSFCKMVMESYGGDITCDSIENEYTEFTLMFPRVV